MTSPGPAFQECTGSCHENFLTPKGVSSEGGIIQSAIDRWSDCIGQDRDSHHLGTLSTILQHFTHTMKPSDPLLLADVTLRCGMYPAGKVRGAVKNTSRQRTLTVLKPNGQKQHYLKEGGIAG